MALTSPVVGAGLMLRQLLGDVVNLAGQPVVGAGLVLGQLLDAVVNLAY